MIKTILLVILIVVVVFGAISNSLYVASETAIVLTRKCYLQKKYRNSETIPEEDLALMDTQFKFVIVDAIKNFKEAYGYICKEQELP